MAPLKPKLPPITMKTKFALACALLAAASLSAAPLTETTAVHVRPAASAPAITFLKAGTEPAIAYDAAGLTPAGWQAVELSGPFEVYVQNKDISKSLDIQPGASFRLSPKADATVIGTMEAGDKTNITGLHGKWTQLSLEKKITGYIRSTGVVASTAAAGAPVLTDVGTRSSYGTSRPAPTAQPATPAALAPAPVQPAVYGVSTAGRPAPMMNLGDGGSGALPRLFQGKFVSTKRAFAPRRPYDWQLNDDAGVRYAYLDVSKLLLTEQIEKYIDHVVVVYGKPKPVPNGRDIVIEIESLQLK